MAIWAVVTTKWVILKKPWSTTTNNLVFQKKWGIGLFRQRPVQIWVVPVANRVILNKQLSTTGNILALSEKRETNVGKDLHSFVWVEIMCPQVFCVNLSIIIDHA